MELGISLSLRGKSFRLQKNKPLPARVLQVLLPDVFGMLLPTVFLLLPDVFLLLPDVFGCRVLSVFDGATAILLLKLGAGADTHLII